MGKDLDQAQNKNIGISLHRREDKKLVSGQGCYVDDIVLDGALHLHFFRSPLPMGRILECDVTTAQYMPGISAIFTGNDVCHLGSLSVNPMLKIEGEFDYPLLAHQYLEAVGQPVLAILSENAHQGIDAVDTVTIDVDEEDVRDISQNRLTGSWRNGDVERLFNEADHVVSVVIEHPRLAPSPMEPRGAVVEYHTEADCVTVWLSTQTPHRARSELAAILSLDETRINVIAPDVGGAFGMKASLYPEEVIAVWAAFQLKRSVRWTAMRGEDFLSASHGRGGRSKGELAVSATGEFLALRAKVECPLGTWLPTSAAVPAWNAARILPCGYDIQAIDIVTSAIASHTAPVGIYRGAGRPEANCLMERLVDEAANVTGLDPFAIRLKNIVSIECFPHRTPTGFLLDSGRYAEALKMLQQRAAYDELLEGCRKRRRRGEIVGIGIGFYVEPCGVGHESARVTLYSDGRAKIATGGSSQGHGRETAFAQIAADMLSLPMNAIDVIHGSTLTCPKGIGALASRSTAIGGSAVKQACEEVLLIKETIEKTSNKTSVEPISVETFYEADGEAWGYGCYLVLLSIDVDTGVITLEEAHCVDDAGNIIHPAMVEGQIRGGFAQGLGEALLEKIVYDEHGQLITGSFMDYGLPRASDIPPLFISKLVTPSPHNALGAKGIGEAGTIGAPATILNAAIDALRSFGVNNLQMPLSSEQIWQAIQNAEKRETHEIFKT